MVRPYLANIYILRRIDEETPPDDVKPDEEYLGKHLVIYATPDGNKYSPAAFKAAELVEPKNDAVRAASKTKDTTHPVQPEN